MLASAANIGRQSTGIAGLMAASTVILCRSGRLTVVPPGRKPVKSLHNPLSFASAAAHIPVLMQIHASCAAREGHGVLLLGPPGSGKSDLVLRLLDHGFLLVADDRVDVHEGVASPPPALAGVLEVRGLGLLRMDHAPHARIELAVELGRGERLPQPVRHATLGVPMVRVDPAACSAVRRIALALDCALGRVTQVAGAFA